MVLQRRIAVVGGGAWGTALAVHAAGLGHAVRLWMHEADLVARMRECRDNPVYLPGIEIPSSVTPVERVEQAVERADLVLGVVPSAFARAVYARLAGRLDSAVPFVTATKGIEEETLALPLDVARDRLGARPLGVISGPSFAPELARGRPTAVVVASADDGLAATVQSTLSSATLRIYANADPVGVQLAGALKNVIAIAAGVTESLDMGPNALAALVTRGLAEIARLGRRMGGVRGTFSGLAGLGDLVLTCTSRLSRNRETGRRLGRGERLTDILSGSRAVAEGVGTTRSARELARRLGVEMPIVEQVHRMLFENGSPVEALNCLMSRPLTSEEELDEGAA